MSSLSTSSKDRFQFTKSNHVYQSIVCLIASCILFGLFSDFRIILPWNYQWLLSHGDAATHYLGFSYFINDIWRWPPGLNPNYGLEGSSSVVYTDSIPLFALLAKVLWSFCRLFDLQTSWNFFGVFLFVGIFMLIYAAQWVLAAFSSDFNQRIIFAFLIASIPIPAWRLMPQLGHLSLTAVAVIVWSIGLYGIYREQRIWIRILCPLVAFGLHPYLGIMVSCMWLGSFLDNILWERGRILKSGLEFAAFFVIITIGLYLYGYFGFDFIEGVPWGYGFFSYNVFDLIDPSGYDLSDKDGLSVNFSSLINGADVHYDSSWESFTYLGLGLVLAVLTGVLTSVLSIRCVRMRPIAKVFATRFFFGVTIYAMLAIAITHEFGIGNNTIFIAEKFYVNQDWIAFLGKIRSSARFAWPFAYLLSLLACGIILRSFRVQRFPKKLIYAILSVLVLVQIIDLAPGHSHLRKSFNINHVSNISSFEERLKDIIDSGVSKESLIYLGSKDDSAVLDLAFVAHRHRLGTNIVYSARSIKGAPKGEDLIGVHQMDAFYVIEAQASGLVANKLCQGYGVCQSETIGKYSLFWAT